MSITRYENIIVNNVTNGIDNLGQYTTTITEWFKTRALVSDVANSLRISEKYRVYQDLVNEPRLSEEELAQILQDIPADPTINVTNVNNGGNQGGSDGNQGNNNG